VGLTIRRGVNLVCGVAGRAVYCAGEAGFEVDGRGREGVVTIVGL
jgi:hypothetical protein